MAGISKSFPGVRALDDVTFACAKGEVHALCGENGAGKSTLMKILGGAYQPDSGRILHRRARGRLRPSGRRAEGRNQHHPSGAEPSALSHGRRECLSRRRADPLRHARPRPDARRCEPASAPARLVDPLRTPKRARLSIAQQQVVEIAKALAVDARILVMDEPTAALERTEAARLLDLVKRLSAEGVALIYVSHRMPEIQAVADRVTVLKDGRTVMTAPIGEAPTARLVRAMVGRDLADFYPPRAAKPPGAPALAIRSAGNRRLVEHRPRRARGRDRRGRGTRRLGQDRAWPRHRRRRAVRAAERWRSRAQSLAPRRPRAAIAAGVGRLSEDRKREGLLMQQSLRDNATLIQRAFARALGAPTAAPMTVDETDERLRRLDVRAANFEQEARLLSGGNQQKVIIVRWLARDPEVLVFAEPTRGIDVAAKAAIYKIMRDLADRGRAILMISSDLPEIVGVSDRILVMREGRIAGELPGGAAEEAIMAIAVGHERSARERARSMSSAEAVAAPLRRRGLSPPSSCSLARSRFMSASRSRPARR